MIFLDTNVVSETLKKQPNAAVIAWLIRHDGELALSSIVIAEIAYGIAKIRDDERAPRLERSLKDWRSRFAGRIHSFDEEAAMAYGEIMGDAKRHGQSMSAPDGMIAAIARTKGGALATRNGVDFRHCGLELINPWEF
ncbi:MAG: type II toxin-antitoxin system VapC family toxin [Rhizobium sp.]|nr:type II toxin-antitoxin system VapC family toxin [Rhizobium sp.]